jgi:hypothetical protein
MTMRSSRPEQVLMAHPSGTQSAAGRYDLQRMARVKCLSGLGISAATALGLLPVPTCDNR